MVIVVGNGRAPSATSSRPSPHIRPHRTAKGLRTPTAPQRVYRDRTGRVAACRPLNLTDYFSVPPEEMDLDDDNDSLESMIDPSGAIEGARIDSDLYYAYSNPGPRSYFFPPYFSLILNCTPASTEPHISPATPHPRHVLRSATRREDWVLPRDTSPDGWAPPSSTAAPSAPPLTALTRQPSIRRLLAQSRTVDFTDFTSRRRSSGREGNNAGPSAEPALATSSRLSLNTTRVPPRRLFLSGRPELPWSPAPDNATPSTDEGSGLGTGTGTPAVQSSRSSPAPHADAVAAHVPLAPTTATGRFAHRLRRGGVRPPESPPAPLPNVMMLRTTFPEPMGDG
jgi:hypothetical protein